MNLDVSEIIDLLDLKSHPEGGYYRQTHKGPDDEAGRPESTAIYYLLEAGDCSAWHRVRDAEEIWHFYAGGPLALTLSQNGHDAETYSVGPDLAMGQRPQVIVPPDCWQTAVSLGLWTLVGCTVVPGFEFSSFEMAPKGWKPTPRSSV